MLSEFCMNNITKDYEKPMIFVCQTQFGSAALADFFTLQSDPFSPPCVCANTHTEALMIKEGSHQQLLTVVLRLRCKFIKLVEIGLRSRPALCLREVEERWKTCFDNRSELQSVSWLGGCICIFLSQSVYEAFNMNSYFWHL